MMKEKLSKEEVLHVAHLARVALTEEEVEKFRVQLKVLMDEVNKIKTVTGYDEALMFTPVTASAKLRQDTVGPMLSSREALANVPRKNGNFIEVPVMINE